MRVCERLVYSLLPMVYNVVKQTENRMLSSMHASTTKKRTKHIHTGACMKEILRSTCDECQLNNNLHQFQKELCHFV